MDMRHNLQCARPEKRQDVLGMEHIHRETEKTPRQGDAVPPEAVLGWEGNDLDILATKRLEPEPKRSETIVGGFIRKELISDTLVLATDELPDQLEEHYLVSGPLLADEPDIDADRDLAFCVHGYLVSGLKRTAGAMAKRIQTTPIRRPALKRLKMRKTVASARTSGSAGKRPLVRSIGRTNRNP